jgi:hypothetical protein
VAAVADLEQIRSERDGAAYPRSILRRCSDALVLFAAGFLGRQDAFWIADAGLTAVCVDVRIDPLHDMAAVYPADWQFVHGDVYALAAYGALDDADLVSIDCPSGHFDRCADMISVWCALARRYVVLGTSGDMEFDLPDGWIEVQRRFRSDFAGGTYWAVLKRTAA